MDPAIALVLRVCSQPQMDDRAQSGSPNDAIQADLASGGARMRMQAPADAPVNARAIDSMIEVEVNPW